jgi:hypothetical protein
MLADNEKEIELLTAKRKLEVSRIELYEYF